MKSPQELDPDWGRYPQTVLLFGDDQSVQIDLRQPVTANMVGRLETIGLAKPFAVITSHDPAGRDVSAEENERRQMRFEREVQELGVPMIPVDACSPDMKHCECSAAITMDRDRAIDLAKRYDQVAIFWFDGSAFWICGVLVQSDPIRLPRSE